MADPCASRVGLLLVASLSLSTLAFVSWSYSSPSPVFLPDNYGRARLQRPPRRPGPGDGHGELDFKSFFTHRSWRPPLDTSIRPYDDNQAYGEGINVSDTREIFLWQLNSSDSSPLTSAVNSSDSKLLNGVMAAPSPTSDTSEAKLHYGVVSSQPNSPGKLSEVEIQRGAPAGPPPSTTAGSGSNTQDKLLGGLLAACFDEGSCLSRYRSASFRRRSSPYKPSPYLVESLRRYEALHERCGPDTDAYKKESLLLLKPGRHAAAARPQCKYLVWSAENGLGNRMVSLASAFLYALLAGRVLLIDRAKDLGSLFCEPFPGSSWLLPADFPLKVSVKFNQKHPQSYGNMLRAYGDTSGAAGIASAPFVYAHLSHDYDRNDKRFFCELDQNLLGKVSWMVLRSDQYFVPALFLVPAFRGRLGRMFPEKEAVFHHLGRYLFHPSNAVWGLITEYYDAHLARASERLGIQIRLHFWKSPPYELVVRQILNCSWAHELLPEVHQPLAPNGTLPKSKAVLLASLHSGFLGGLQRAYRGHAELSFHQPSHEARQQTGREEHDVKALAEMYLLSMADKLVTSVWSTFGYVAQGLGGLSPWILRGPVHTRVPEPACVRAVSMEPCFHYPPNYDCATGGYMETRRTLPFTGKCRDRKGGLKLVARKRKTDCC